MESINRERLAIFIDFAMTNDMTKRINKNTACMLFGASLRGGPGGLQATGETVDKVIAYLSMPDDAPFDKISEYAFARILGSLRRSLNAGVQVAGE